MNRCATQSLEEGLRMAYREVGTMDMEQVIRRWLAGEKVRGIARLTGLDRNTIRRIVRSAEKGGSPARGAMARRRRATSDTTGHRPAWGDCGDQRGRAAAKAANQSDWNLAAKRAPVADQSARAIRPRGAATITVRRAESLAGEMAEADFGRLGLLKELGSCRRRMVHGFILTLGYSQLTCVIPVFKQDLPTIIDCFERALAFFGGCPRRIVIDGMKTCIDQSNPYTPRFNRTLLEYATCRGFLPDPARPVHPKDKPVVENSVRYVRERFFKGEIFIDLDDVAGRALGGLRSGREAPANPAAGRTLRYADLGPMQSTSGSSYPHWAGALLSPHALDRVSG
jgi:hypothetical protein